jgi:hypothetical protein
MECAFEKQCGQPHERCNARYGCDLGFDKAKVLLPTHNTVYIWRLSSNYQIVNFVCTYGNALVFSCRMNRE